MILEGLYLLSGCHKHIRDGATQCGHLQTELQSIADKGRNKGKVTEHAHREQWHLPMMPALEDPGQRISSGPVSHRMFYKRPCLNKGK